MKVTFDEVAGEQEKTRSKLNSKQQDLNYSMIVISKYGTLPIVRYLPTVYPRSLVHFHTVSIL